MDRRRFLSHSLGASAVLSLGALPPRFLMQAAASRNSTLGETVLVIVQLSGGNDGLNTVAPYADDVYRNKRPTLGLTSDDVLKIDDYCGFHPALRGFADLLEEGKLGVVQSVGYPNPNRSHFESMDIWHTATQDKSQRATGWLGRYLDASSVADDQAVKALHFGNEKQPLALAARASHVPSLRNLEQFRLQGGDEELLQLVREAAGIPAPADNPLLGFVQSSAASALAASDRVAARVRNYQPQVEYPDSQLARKLKLTAQLMDADLGTRVFYVELNGFDTHSQQADAHAALLRQFGDATAAFWKDIEAHGHGDRTLLVGFSEFGRRVEENASGGTDHGAACAPVPRGQDHPARPVRRASQLDRPAGRRLEASHGLPTGLCIPAEALAGLGCGRRAGRPLFAASPLAITSKRDFVLTVWLDIAVDRQAQSSRWRLAADWLPFPDR